MTKTTDINCPITILKALKKNITSEVWVNKLAQSNITSGIDLSIGRLRKYGYNEVDALVVRNKPRVEQSGQLSFL